MEIKFCESNLESALIEKLIENGYEYGAVLSGWGAERRLDSFIDEGLLFERLAVINKGVRHGILEETVKQIKQIDNPSLFARNHIFHKYLIDGITIDDYHARINPHIRCGF